MGQTIIKGVSPHGAIIQLPLETQLFTLWTLSDVVELYRRFSTQIFGYALVKAQFESIMSFKAHTFKNVVTMEALFEMLDNDHDGRIDGLELLGGVALCCQATFEEKIKFCFELYDFNLNATLSKKEMIMMMMASICGMNLLAGGSEELEPELSLLEQLADDAFNKADKDGSKQISYEEFVVWARSSRDLMAGLEKLNKIAIEAKNDFDAEDSAEEADEVDISDIDDDSDDDDKDDDSDDNKSIGKPKRYGFYRKFVVPTVGEVEVPKEDLSEQFEVIQWKGVIHEPTSYVPSGQEKEGPESNLELMWAYGYNAKATSALRYIELESNPNTTKIVYSTATLGVVYDTETRKQTFYSSHSHEITCMAIHPSGLLVATGDINSNIHIWSTSTMSTVYLIKCMIAQGVKHVVFSPTGDRITTVGLDTDHSIVTYETTTGSLLSSAKGISNSDVRDIAYSLDGTEMCIVGTKQIKFFHAAHTMNRSLSASMGRIGSNGKKQTFCCVTYLEKDAIVGCASGELYRFSKGHLVQSIQAHGVREPVLCIQYSSKDGTLLTGGKDSLIKMWDSSLKTIGSTLDMSEDLDGDGKADVGSLNSSIAQIHVISDRILIGTRGSDIFEATIPANPNESFAVTRLAWGHTGYEINYVASHPTRNEFATCGSDKTIRVWSIRSHEQLNSRLLPSQGTAITYNGTGDLIAMGLNDGTIALMEANSPTMRVFLLWKHSAQRISCIRFSPDERYLVSSSYDGNIYVYKKDSDRKYIRYAVCSGHGARVTHFDISGNSQYIQSNSSNAELMFWDMQGNFIKNTSSLRDTIWDTLTCVYSWHVQGIWPQSYDYTEINACIASSDVGDIVVGDKFNHVKLYRYPCIHPLSPFQTYIGHASGVKGVTFNNTRRYVISIGERDGTILLWKHTLEQVDDSDDEMIRVRNKKGKSTHRDIDSDNEDDEFASEFIDLNQDIYEVKSEVVSTIKSVDVVVPPWKSSLIEPSDVIVPSGSTDVDFDLEWIHGFNSSDCRNSVRYNAAGAIIFSAGTVSVAFNKSAWKQKFLQGAHTGSILGLSSHPSGQIFATGDASAQPMIIIWNSRDMYVINRIENCHLNGIPFLSFNTRGNLLLAVGLDSNNTLTLYDWAKGFRIMQTTTSKQRVLCACFLMSGTGTSVAATTGTIVAGTSSTLNTNNNDITSSSSSSGGADSQTVDHDYMVTGGEKHLKFWWAVGQNVMSQTALWGQESVETIMCVASASPGNICVTGTFQGNLMIWYKFKAVGSWLNKSLGFPNPHGNNSSTTSIVTTPNSIISIWGIPGSGAIASFDETYIDIEKIYYTSPRYITGDRLGNVCIWIMVRCGKQDELQLICAKSFNKDELMPKPIGVGIISLCERDGLILIGTSGSEIYEVMEDSIKFNQVSETGPKDATSVNVRSAAASVTATPSAEAASLSAVSSSMAKPVVAAAKQPVIETSAGAGVDINAEPVNEVETGDTANATSAATAVLTDTATAKEITAKPVEIGIRSQVTASVVAPVLAPAVANESVAGSFRYIDDHIKSQMVLSGHSQGELWGLATHPQLPFYFTAGDDCTLRLWSLIDHKILSYATLPEKCRCIAIDPLGADIAICMNSGVVAILELSLFTKLTSVKASTATAASIELSIPFHTGSVKKLFSPMKHWSQVMTYSHDGAYLAVGSHDHKIYLYDVKKEYILIDTPLMVHDSYITHIDFGIILKSNDDMYEVYHHTENKIRTFMTGTDTGKVSVFQDRDIGDSDIVLQATSGDKQLSHWHVNGTKVASSSTIKDAWWSSWTAPYGWPVQGLWGSTVSDSPSINAVARSHAWSKVPVIAAVDEAGLVKIYNYPCTAQGAPDKSYKGHNSHITNVSFSHDDSYCISIGGLDRCVFIWATDVLEELREKSTLGATNAIMSKRNMPVTTADVAFRDRDDDVSLPYKAPVAGDQFMAIKPWKGAIREPSNWKDSNNVGGMPDAGLELKFVYGYRGWDCRNNVVFAATSSEIIYHIAGVGIVYNTQTHTQTLNTEHNDDIISLAVHPHGHTIASGEIGAKPKLVLWDANTGVTIRVILFHRAGISNTVFSGCGNLIVSVGMDNDRTVAVHNVKSGSLVGKGKIGKGIDVLSMAVIDGKSIMTVGKNHIKFWELPLATAAGGELSSKGGIYHKNVKSRYIISSTCLGSDYVTGTIDGQILLWKEKNNTKYVAAHDGPVTCMCALVTNIVKNDSSSSHSGSRIITGGKDGYIHIWNSQLVKEKTININECKPSSCLPQIQAICCKDGKLIFGTKGSEIYEINMLNDMEVYCWVRGHYNERSEAWGLAVHPASEKFVTAGDDMTIRVWDAKTRQQVYVSSFGVKVRAIVYSPGGAQIATAGFDGRVRVLSPDLQTIIADVPVATEWMQALQYSPDGSTLAVGSHDNFIYLLDTKTFSCRAKCKGHNSFVTAIDFSSDSKYLQSTSGDYELLFWDTTTSKQIKSATQMRDVKWATSSCTLGWAVQGMWPPESDGTDINAVDRSHDEHYIVTGDDYRTVKLFTYPCCKPQSICKVYKGHSEHVMNVRFSHNDKYVYSIGGLDKAILQFEVKKTNI